MSKFKRYERYKDSGVEWIGEIPEHWICCKLGYLLNKNESGTWGDDYDDDGVLVLRSTEITLNGTWSIVDPARRRIHAKEYERCLLYEGDLLLTKSSGSEQHIGKTVIVDDNVANMNCVFSNFIQRLRTDKRKLLPKYLYYFLNTNGREQLFYLSTTTTGLKNLSGTTINSLKIQLPTIYEQIAIASFLDQKTAEIDGLIADKEKFIELLQEKRQTIITEAVTKGLNPNVSMKDSGIEWIGEIPENWKVTKVKYYYDVCLGKMIQPNQEDYSDTLEYYLCAINVTWDGIDISNLKEMWFSNEDKKKYSIKSGDLIVCEGGDVGRASIWDGRVENCYIQNAVHRVREKKNSLNKYLYYWLYFLKHAGYIDLICNKATIMHYTYEKFLNTILVIPHLGEQQEIINYLDEKIEEINSLKKEIEQQIQKLKEYRQSLIFEAVTGKIDVRDYADNYLGW
ncbi:MAG: restriction endonuclease subunit S, partial [Thermacetogeniaceae bacterium]